MTTKSLVFGLFGTVLLAGISIYFIQVRSGNFLPGIDSANLFFTDVVLPAIYSAFAITILFYFLVPSNRNPSLYAWLLLLASIILGVIAIPNILDPNPFFGVFSTVGGWISLLLGLAGVRTAVSKLSRPTGNKF